MGIIETPIERVVPYARNPRKNEDAVVAVAASIAEFGFRQPIVVDEQMVVVAGHTRLLAARMLGLKTVPVHVAKGLTSAQILAYRLMDNRSHQNAAWDEDLLKLELADIRLDDFDLSLTGFSESALNDMLAALDETVNGKAPVVVPDAFEHSVDLGLAGDEGVESPGIVSVAGHPPSPSLMVTYMLCTRT